MNYVRIADRFVLQRGPRREEYVGSVFASRDAIFFHFASTSSGAVLSLLTNLIALPGLGGRFARWAERESELLRPRVSVPLDRLPPDITEDPDWPLVSEDGHIAVLPKTSEVTFESSPIAGLTVRTPHEEFRIALSVFRRRGRLDELRWLGWRV